MGRNWACTIRSEVALALLLALSIFCSAACSDLHKDNKQSDNEGCHDEEREALLKFKHGLKNFHLHLDSWNAESRPDCCKWTGITCHNLTGYVLKLDLRGEYHKSNYNEPYTGDWSLSGVLSPALLELKHLRYLDLSDNRFTGASIPSFLGSIRELQYLNLSYSGFYGEIPSQLGNLSKLQYLDVGSNDYGLRSSSVKWLEGMLNLKYLNMNQVFLSNAARPHFWEHAANNLTFLLELHLMSCTFPDTLPVLNLTTLRVLDLSFNSHSSNIPTWLASISSLESLDLSFNNLHGPLPYDGLSKLPHLQTLDLNSNFMIVGNCSYIFATGWTSIRKMDLSRNQFNGEIPGSIGHLSSLVELDLNKNDLAGIIPDSIGNLTSLLNIDLSSNRLGGKIPNAICHLHSLRKLFMQENLLEELPQCSHGSHLINSTTTLHNLESIDLSSNNLHGTIPSWLGDLPSLSDLSLSSNNLHGTLPPALSKVSTLTTLILGNNSLSGSLDETYFERLSQLKFLDLSSNLLAIDIRNDWVPPFQLNVLDVGSCLVGTRFPLWLQTQNHIWSLGMSNTSLGGTLPRWFWQWASSPSFPHLSLSHNHIEGHLPKSLTTLFFLYLDLSYNKMSGSLPQIRSSNNSGILDISANNFYGPIPQSLGSFYILLAHSNQLSGPIPSSIFQACKLKFFDISKNQITGKIPPNIGNCGVLEKLDLSSNYLFGDIPESIGNLTALKSLHLNKNTLSGKLPVSIGKCGQLEVLDIGQNQISGSIAPLMFNTSLRVLRLHENSFEGEIPTNISRMHQLQVFDVSHNRLSGRIPQFPPMQGLDDGNITESSSYGHFAELYVEKVVLLIKGLDLVYDRILHLVTSIDLSDNHFQGEIPEKLMSLSKLKFLNMSYNELMGQIPWSIGELVNLESLDFSNNRLTGAIPQSLSQLMFLSKLNFSNNRLLGRIPTGPQFLTFDASSYANNLDLCGPPLEKSCQNATDLLSLPVGDRHGSASTIVTTWFYIGMLSGFAVGFWVVFGTLVLRRDLRFAFFNFCDAMTNKFIVAVPRIIKMGNILMKNGGSE